MTQTNAIATPPPDASLPLLLTANQVAALFRISRQSLYRRLAKGKAPMPVGTDGHPRWRRSDVLAWIDALPERQAKPRHKPDVSSQ